MCTFFNINEHSNYARDFFFITISVLGIMWLGFLHFDILKYKRWAMEYVKPIVAGGDLEDGSGSGFDQGKL